MVVAVIVMVCSRHWPSRGRHCLWSSSVAYPGFLNGRGRGSAGAESGGYGEGVFPLPTGGRVWGGGCPLTRKFSVFFVENTTFWRILTRLFLTSQANGGILTPLTTSSVRHWSSLSNPMLGSAKRKYHRLTSREIIFKIFQPMWSQSQCLRVTDKRLAIGQ